jgi:1,4-dihydroxy-2-naphthoyl-CoA hydrolase
MALWFKDYTLEELQAQRDTPTLATYLGMEFTELGPDYIKGTLPVDEKTKQIHGILHGGATCVLTETLGSVASLLVINPETQRAVGSMITTNHLRPTSSGKVTGICRAVHIGKSKHVWDIQVFNEEGKLTAKTELTCAVISKNA